MYLGFNSGDCYEDIPSRLLPVEKHIQANSRENCIAKCAEDGFKYAGTQYSFQCWCGNDTPSKTLIRSQEECKIKCSGDQSQYCGGDWRINIYEIKGKFERVICSVLLKGLKSVSTANLMVVT